MIQLSEYINEAVRRTNAKSGSVIKTLKADMAQSLKMVRAKIVSFADGVLTIANRDEVILSDFPEMFDNPEIKEVIFTGGMADVDFNFKGNVPSYSPKITSNWNVYIHDAGKFDIQCGKDIYYYAKDVPEVGSSYVLGMGAGHIRNAHGMEVLSGVGDKLLQNRNFMKGVSTENISYILFNNTGVDHSSFYRGFEDTLKAGDDKGALKYVPTALKNLDKTVEIVIVLIKDTEVALYSRRNLKISKLTDLGSQYENAWRHTSPIANIEARSNGAVGGWFIYYGK